MAISPEMGRLKGKIAEHALRQGAVADLMGMAEATFSSILHGRIPKPDGFEERVMAAVDRLAKAEEAAEEARQRVLAGEAE